MEDQDPIVSALKSLVPAAAQLDVVSAAYAAGRRQVGIWRGAAGLSLVLCIAAWMAPRGEKTIALVRQNNSAVVAMDEPMGPIPHESILYLQEAVLAHGLAGLPAGEARSASPVVLRDLN